MSELKYVEDQLKQYGQNEARLGPDHEETKVLLKTFQLFDQKLAKLPEKLKNAEDASIRNYVLQLITRNRQILNKALPPSTIKKDLISLDEIPSKPAEPPKVDLLNIDFSPFEEKPKPAAESYNAFNVDLLHTPAVKESITPASAFDFNVFANTG